MVDHCPVESAIVVPTSVLPSYKLIVTPGSAVPDIVGVGFEVDNETDGLVITGALTPIIITFTVADAVAPWLSDIVYENESEP